MCIGGSVRVYAGDRAPSCGGAPQGRRLCNKWLRRATKLGRGGRGRRVVVTVVAVVVLVAVAEDVEGGGRGGGANGAWEGSRPRARPWAWAFYQTSRCKSTPLQAVTRSFGISPCDGKPKVPCCIEKSSGWPKRASETQPGKKWRGRAPEQNLHW